METELRLRQCSAAGRLEGSGPAFPLGADEFCAFIPIFWCPGDAEDAYKIRIRIDDEPANLDILDTAGQAEFTAMRDQYMRAGEGFIICYSITDRRSFHEVREFKQLIYRLLQRSYGEEGSALAREFSCPFFETSAAFRYYIDDVFHALVREIRRKDREAAAAMERKSRPKSSVWKRLKSPFRRKKDSVT
uniref:Ras like without CAAX 1 n=1 Tax=Zonotrichia albicollis TaxID=44394 RepID=A0A8D2MNS6_ZONAL